MARVFVAMSGGVDSSLAAALLVEQGHDVVGVTMQLWPSTDEEGGCCSVSAAGDARRVCDTLGIPHYALDFRGPFEDGVVAPFAAAYARGRTPNPCIDCNDRLKFSELLRRVSLQDAEFLATGHYARIVRDEGGGVRLARAADRRKDQSYFLYRMTPPQLARALFPLGDYTKDEVRVLAEERSLPTAKRPESQDICFDRGGSHHQVVVERQPCAAVRGDIVDSDGRVVGAHSGIASFTVGQRKGLGVGGMGEPVYVVGIDPSSNTVRVGSRDELAVMRVEASDVVWNADEPVTRAVVMVRSRMEPVPARVSFEDGVLVATVDRPLYAVAPGQALVCYRDDTVVGGGTIVCAS